MELLNIKIDRQKRGRKEKVVAVGLLGQTNQEEPSTTQNPIIKVFS